MVSIRAIPVIHPNIIIGRLSGRTKTAAKIAALLAPKTNPEAMPPNKVIPNKPSTSEMASSKNIDKLSPIIVQITGNIISSGIVVTKKKHKHFAAA